jgi:hypothetical protein
LLEYLFVFTWLLSHWVWHVGHWPFFLSDVDASLKTGDYQTVFSGLYSEHYFESNSAQFWTSLFRVFSHQGRFLFWNYLFLAVEIAIVLSVTLQYGRLHQHAWFRNTFGRLLLRRVSEWEPLFTDFVFHPRERRRVEVDLMTDKHLYRGTVENHFVGKDGELRGLLLKDAKRFQYSRLESDRVAGKQRATEQYWKEIPGSNLYVSFEKVVTLNLRYELPQDVLLKRLRDKIQSATGISGNIVFSSRSPGEFVVREEEESNPS